MKRKIIKINEEKCDGCGVCVPSCNEGALQIIDGKARLISDLFCDGLGACLGECPQGAIEIEEREAEAYDELKVIQQILIGGRNVVLAHLNHLKNHGEWKYLTQAKKYLEENDFEFTEEEKKSFQQIIDEKENFDLIKMPSELENWPIQLHLISPSAGYFQNADLLVAADCCGFASPNFHNEFLKNKKLIIACPKLDSNKQIYYQKLISLMTDAKVNSITVLIMQVPCCGGLANLVLTAAEAAGANINIEIIVLNIKGEIIKRDEYFPTQINVN